MSPSHLGTYGMLPPSPPRCPPGCDCAPSPYRKSSALSMPLSSPSPASAASASSHMSPSSPPPPDGRPAVDPFGGPSTNRHRSSAACGFGLSPPLPTAACPVSADAIALPPSGQHRRHRRVRLAQDGQL